MLTLHYTMKETNPGVNLFPLFMNASIDGILEEGNTLKITIETINKARTKDCVRFIERNLSSLCGNQEVHLSAFFYQDEKETVLELKKHIQMEDGFHKTLELHRFKKSILHVEKIDKSGFSEAEQKHMIETLFLVIEKERDDTLESLIE